MTCPGNRLALCQSLQEAERERKHTWSTCTGTGRDTNVFWLTSMKSVTSLLLCWLNCITAVYWVCVILTIFIKWHRPTVDDKLRQFQCNLLPPLHHLPLFQLNTETHNFKDSCTDSTTQYFAVCISTELNVMQTLTWSFMLPSTTAAEVVVLNKTKHLPTVRVCNCMSLQSGITDKRHSAQLHFPKYRFCVLQCKHKSWLALWIHNATWAWYESWLAFSVSHVIFTLASEVMVTSRILVTHSLSSSWLLAATSSNGPVRMEVLGTKEKTWGLLPFPSGRTTEKTKKRG